MYRKAMKKDPPCFPHFVDDLDPSNLLNLAVFSTDNNNNTVSYSDKLTWFHSTKAKQVLVFNVGNIVDFKTPSSAF